jgi:phenylacetate-CoA ligase
VPPGEPGEIVITHLATRHFPFIRYRTGDIGVWDSRVCGCGRGLLLLKEIQGRSTDFLVGRDGALMHGLALIYILRDLPQIENFKIIQENKRLTRILIVSHAELKPEIAKQIEQDFKSRLGDEVNIVIERIAEIPAERSGKFRYVVSKITSQ